MNITEPVRRHAVMKPTAVAFVRIDGTEVTYRAFDGMIDAVAEVLGDLGAEPGLTAGLSMAGADPFPPLVVALAMARIGVVSSDTRLPAADLDLSCPGLGETGVAGVPALPVSALWAAMPERPEDVPPGPIHQGGAAICRIFGTSGTSGRPKFVPASHDLLANRVLAKSIALGERDDMHLCATAFGAAMGFHDMLRSLFAGGTLVLSTPSDAIAAVRRHRVNSMLMSPAMLGSLLQAMPDSDTPPPAMVEIEVSGGTLPGPILALAERKLCDRIVSVYGASETHVIASAPARMLGGRPGAVGMVHPGVRVEAIDAAGEPLPAGETGVLRIGGPAVAAGYTADEGPTDGAFRDGWFVTGDLGSVSADGWVTLHGRANEVINAGGVKVSPAAIEEVLLALPGVRDAAAFAMEDARQLQHIWAAVVLEPGTEIAALAIQCGRRLNEQAPRFFLPLTEIPRNANGKILRDALIVLARNGQSASGVA